MDQSPLVEDGASDDEVFCGPITLKEIKKTLCRPWPWDMAKRPEDLENYQRREDINMSFRRTQSKQNLRGDIAEYNSPISSKCSPLIKTSDERLLEKSFEKLLPLTEKTTQNMHLKNDPIPQTPSKMQYKDEEDSQLFEFNENEIKTKSPLKEIPDINSHGDFIKPELREPSSPNYHTPAKVMTDTPQFKTPTCCLHLLNQSSESCLFAPIKLMAPRKTAGRLKNYAGITSPVADYLRNSPQVPLVKDAHPKKVPKTLMTPRKTAGQYAGITSRIADYIRNPQVSLVKDAHPKKPLPAKPLLPRLAKHTEVKSHARNEEKVNLPSVAYKSAKMTKIIHQQDVNKLQKSQCAKKFTSSIPTVRKHESRKVDLEKEDSIAMSVDQAVGSLCTQKTAFKP